MIVSSPLLLGIQHTPDLDSQSLTLAVLCLLPSAVMRDGASSFSPYLLSAFLVLQKMAKMLNYITLLLLIFGFFH